MSGVQIKSDLRELDRLQRRLDSFSAKIRNPAELLDGLASLLEAQTKRRIQDEKTDPEGNKWDEWSKDYARTRKRKHSLLIDTQSMLDDIAGSVDGDAAVVGSSMIYAGSNQKARPFLGISGDNASEIDQLITDWIDDRL